MDAIDRLLKDINLSDPAGLRILALRVLHQVDWWFLLWLTLASAVVGLLLGRVKGTPLKGLILGALLGPIGWAILLFSKGRLPECPSCGRGNVPGAKRCRHCGADFARIAQQTARSQLNADHRRRGW